MVRWTASVTVVAAAVAIVGASSAAANRISTEPWGGIEFETSDRDVQAAGSILGLAVDPAGKAIVAIGEVDSIPTRVYAYRFDPEGRQRGRFRVDDDAVAVGVARRKVYVATRRGTVTVYGTRGDVRRRVPIAGRPVALAVDRAANLYVATDTGVRRYSKDGRGARSFGRPGLLRLPRGIAVDARGEVFVADAAARRVVEFTPTGRVRRIIGGPRPAQGSLVKPTGVGVDEAGHVIVADTASFPNDPDSLSEGPHLMRFTADGRYEAPIDGGFEAPYLYFKPLYLAVAPRGDVYFMSNPDLKKLPARLVDGPRFQIEDPSRQVTRRELSPVAVGVRATYVARVRIFRSLSTRIRASIDPGPGVELVSGAADRRLARPKGRGSVELSWTLRPISTGRHTPTVSLSGVGPEGDVTRFSKRLPLYATGRSSVSILGAGYLAAEREVVVGTRVDFGFPVPADEQAEFEDVTDAFASVTARGAGSTLAPGGSFIRVTGGYCQIFPIPLGSALTDPLVVDATYPGYEGSPPATTTATVRPEARVENRSLASCLEVERR